jgi:hypothetical protein
MGKGLLLLLCANQSIANQLSTIERNNKRLWWWLWRTNLMSAVPQD